MKKLAAIAATMLLHDIPPIFSISEPLRLPPNKKPTGALKQRRAAKKRRNMKRRGL